MEIIHEDKRIFVVVKPHGVLSTDEPGGLPELVRREIHQPDACLRTVHRLDAAVGGLMVLARSVKAASLLSAQVRERRFQKEYLAVVRGQPPQSGTLRDLLARDPRRRITYVADQPGKDVRAAELFYEVLDRKDSLSLVRIELHTGRTHQIRVQFSSRGWPLAGDRKYSPDLDADFPIAHWSWRLRFTHPETDAPMDFAHLPPETAPWMLFQEALNRLEPGAHNANER